MTIALLYNPMSGTGRAQRVALRIKAELESSGWGVQMVATQAGDPSRWLRAELESMAAVNAIEALVVAGGDGAVRLAAAESARGRMAEQAAWVATTARPALREPLSMSEP